MQEEFSHFFEVRSDLFEGPIDLLLHLVKQNELPIEKLSLAQVTSQYLQTLERLRYFDLEIAGEYLVIAATLLSIKASVLLNDPIELVVDDEGNLVNPHDELLRRLREAAVYRDGAAQLGGRDMLGVDVFQRSAGGKGANVPVTYRDHDASLLSAALRKVFSQLGKEVPEYSISMDSVSVVERMRVLLDRLKECDGPIEFSDLIPDKTSRMSIIGSFVAILELCKRAVVRVTQDELFDRIVISLASRDFDPQAYYRQPGFESEFDQPTNVEEGEAAEAADATVNG